MLNRCWSKCAAAGSMLLLFAVAGVAQTPPPRPGPEVQRLGYFSGSWTFDGEYKTEPKGKYSGTMTCDWFEGGFVQICKAQFSGVRGPQSEMHIWSYSPQDQAYLWYSLGTAGAGRMPRKCTLSGSKWSCGLDDTFQGKAARYHYEIVEESSTAWSFGYTRTAEGQSAVPMVDVKFTKTK